MQSRKLDKRQSIHRKNRRTNYEFTKKNLDLTGNLKEKERIIKEYNEQMKDNERMKKELKNIEMGKNNKEKNKEEQYRIMQGQLKKEQKENLELQKQLKMAKEKKQKEGNKQSQNTPKKNEDRNNMKENGLNKALNDKHWFQNTPEIEEDIRKKNKEQSRRRQDEMVQIRNNGTMIRKETTRLQGDDNRNRRKRTDHEEINEKGSDVRIKKDTYKVGKLDGNKRNLPICGICKRNNHEEEDCYNNKNNDKD